MKYYVTSKISENIHETPEGYLICIGVPIARIGTQVYGEGETPLETADGQIEIYRDEKEVFNPKTIASFEGKAITIRHPTDFVNPDNWSQLAKGIMQNVRRGKDDNKDDLIADLLITETMAIGLVKNGLREVSCGYEAEYIQTEKGKGIQKNIVGNHLALVEQGRAGPGYAINDHKGETKMNLKERIKAIFAKAQDEAMQLAADEEKKKDKKSGDEDPDKKDDKGKDEKGASYDELVQMIKDLGEKVAAMKPSKDKDKEDDKKDDSKDDDQVEKSMEDRLKALEMAMSKLLDAKAGDEDKEDGDDDESEDDDFDESTLVGDSAEIASRAEILAPGLKMSKDIKVKALKASYETKEGKKVIDGLTGGKPTFDSAEKVDTLFVAASEVIKAQRTDELSKTKRTKDGSGNGTVDEGAMTAEKLNEINSKFWNKQV